MTALHTTIIRIVKKIETTFFFLSFKKLISFPLRALSKAFLNNLPLKVLTRILVALLPAFTIIFLVWSSETKLLRKTYDAAACISCLVIICQTFLSEYRSLFHISVSFHLYHIRQKRIHLSPLDLRSIELCNYQHKP